MCSTLANDDGSGLDGEKYVRFSLGSAVWPNATGTNIVQDAGSLYYYKLSGSSHTVTFDKDSSGSNIAANFDTFSDLPQQAEVKLYKQTGGSSYELLDSDSTTVVGTQADNSIVTRITSPTDSLVSSTKHGME